MFARPVIRMFASNGSCNSTWESTVNSFSLPLQASVTVRPAGAEEVNRHKVRQSKLWHHPIPFNSFPMVENASDHQERGCGQSAHVAGRSQIVPVDHPGAHLQPQPLKILNLLQQADQTIFHFPDAASNSQKPWKVPCLLGLGVRHGANNASSSLKLMLAMPG